MATIFRIIRKTVNMWMSNYSLKKLFTSLRYFLILLFIFLYTNSAHAIDITMPLSCNYGKDCFISNYFDHDAKVTLVKDHSCGNMSTDGYKSTDFILKNIKQMKDGVNVTAGDSGVVKYARNDVDDVNVDLSGTEAVRGFECGNGVIIEHKRGYETQYCHLKKGSVTVKRGDKVEKGQNIGEVGLSGLTSFPHLQFTVRMNGKALDPFTGEDPVNGQAEVACDSLDVYPLWDKATEKILTYINTTLLTSGFSGRVPNARGAREGRYKLESIPNNTKLLAYWVDILGAMKGDTLKLSIFSPKGEELLSTSKVFTGDKRQLFQFIGIKLENGKDKWENGEYSGKVELLRDVGGKTSSVISSSARVEIAEPLAK